MKIKPWMMLVGLLACEPVDDETPGQSGLGDARVVDAESADMGAADSAVELRECLQTVTIGDLEIFAFEASRSDAQPSTSGTSEEVCSRAGVLPWATISLPEAEAACTAAGFHLCDDDEWLAACSGDRQWTFPYGPRHIGGRCNDHVSGAGELLPTGSYMDCQTPEGVFDLSGNLWELTASGSRRGASYRVNAVMFRKEAARCDVTYVAIEGFTSDDAGFRCCRTAGE